MRSAAAERIKGTAVGGFVFIGSAPMPAPHDRLRQGRQTPFCILALWKAKSQRSQAASSLDTLSHDVTLNGQRHRMFNLVCDQIDAACMIAEPGIWPVQIVNHLRDIAR
jgi:hypothetical protein